MFYHRTKKGTIYFFLVTADFFKLMFLTVSQFFLLTQLNVLLEQLGLLLGKKVHLSPCQLTVFRQTFLLFALDKLKNAGEY